MRTRSSFQCVLLICAIVLCTLPAAYADPIGWPYPDTISGVWCSELTHDFHLEYPLCYDWYYQLLSGPGSIGEYDGIWHWWHYNDRDTGTYDLVLKILKKCDGTYYHDTVTVHVIDGGIEITSGGGTSSMMTGQVTERQFTSTTQPCPPTNWTTLRRGGGGLTEYSIDENGLFNFSPTTPGIWTFDVWVGTYIWMSEPVMLRYYVHGGPGCCVGTRGDITADGLLDLSDLSRLIAYMTSPYIVLNCWDAANIDNAGSIDLTDLSMLISHMIGGEGAFVLPPCP